MKFLVDAHLPLGLCRVLQVAGHDALHTSKLPDGNATSDADLNRISLAEQRIVISKDADFFYSHILQRQPWKLILVRTGNLGRQALLKTFQKHWPAIEAALADNTLIELDQHRIHAKGLRIPGQ